jgi:hypothetical protein
MPLTYRAAIRASIVLLLLASCAAPTTRTPTTRRPVEAPPTAAAVAVKPPGLLQKPTTASVVVKGLVKIDPSYLLSNNGGSLISNNSGAVLAVGDTRLGSGNLVSNNGDGVIANNAGNIVASGNGGVMARRQVLAAPEGGTALVPAAGMAVSVRSLRTGQRVPVGVNGQGEPVYTVYSNLAGGFELFIPAAEAGNVLIESAVPGAQDPRLAYDALAATGAGVDQIVDDDTSVGAAMFRQAMVRRLYDFLVQPPEVLTIAIKGGLPPALQDRSIAVMEQLHTAAAAVGVSGDEGLAPSVWALAAACADEVAARANLDEVVLDHAFAPHWSRCAPRETVMDAMRIVFRSMREGAAIRLAADPTYFERMPYLTAANACKPGTYVIKRPMDLPVFYVNEYMAPNRWDAFSWQDAVLYSIEGGRYANGQYNGVRLSAVSLAILNAMLEAFEADKQGGRSAILARIAAFRPGKVPAGAPTPGLPPCPVPSESPPPALEQFELPKASPCGDATVTAADVAAARQIYLDVLGREPDEEGGRAMAQGFANGSSKSEARLQMAASVEAQQVMHDAYRKLKGRTPTDAEAAEWRARVGQDTSVATMKKELAQFRTVSVLSHLSWRPSASTPS